jgi:hypothetical protein
MIRRLAYQTGSKLSDSEDDVSVRRELKDWLRNKLERRQKSNKAKYKRFCNKARDKVNTIRKETKIKNENKVRHIRMRRKQEEKFKLPPELERYKEAKIFSEQAEELFQPGQILGPVIVGGNTTLLSKEEAMVLAKGPKFTIRRVLSKEKFLVEMEKAYIKVRWSLKDEDTNDKKELSEAELAEQKRVEEIAEWEQVKAKMVYSKEDNTINFRKQRCTDTKHNTRLILPAPLSNQRESELDMRRVQWSAIYDKYIAEFCDEEGVQEANLSVEEARGLESLKKRVADGSLIICQTDKSSRFAVMSEEEYLEAGRKHTASDEEVDIDFLIKNQTVLNGHVSMLMKTFCMGADWDHEARIRATKITLSLSVAPLYLLFKDHKSWSVEIGGPPPTRPVVSAGGGQNDHTSEIVSQALEPVASAMHGGMETGSTQDFVSQMVTLNVKGRNWR